MEFRTEILHIDPGFPFAVFHGSGFSGENSGYMHRHHSLEINYCLQGCGRYFIGDRETTEFWTMFGLDPETKELIN